ncbi:hypothetical protein [Colwellia psychrerythraea]|uniref:Lipoprotein n=1 Tax=Colwellia psychrerythraea TaxID=28229 RepID=A0A099KSF7_COLPS|nr:hypothetical protein [Colwellia psychrerythraea]KGJ93684.1 hypothetical protein ND2E_2177 [Colwellia psychrerythraea]
MIKTKIASVFLVSFLAGCSSLLSDSSHISTGDSFEATKVSEIKIYFELPKQAYTVIGLVESHGTGLTQAKEKERALQALKVEAASIGAHGVIITNSSMKKLSGFDGEPAGEENIINGKAIRFN